MVQETPAGQTILQSLLGDGLNGYGTPSIISPARPYYIFAGGGEKKGCVRVMSHQPSEEQHGSSVPVSPAKYRKEGSSKPFIWVWARRGDCHLIPGLDFCSEEGLLIFPEFM